MRRTPVWTGIILSFLFFQMACGQPASGQDRAVARLHLPAGAVRLRLLYEPRHGLTRAAIRAVDPQALAVLTGGFYAEGHGLSPAGLIIWRGRCEQAPSRRADALRQVTRYRLFKIMYYRTNLLTHSRRVSWHVRALLPYLLGVFGKRFDADRAVAIALVHDDHEIVLGDVQLANKLRMTPAQLVKLDQVERRAIATTAGRFPDRLKSWRYEDLLLEKLAMKTLESQIVTYLDKFEAFGEALHELFAGNRCFAAQPTNHLGTHPIPTQVYASVFSDYPQRYPATAPAFAARKQPFHSLAIDANAVAERGQPHTLADLAAPSGYPPYDYWRRVLIEYANEHELANLTRQKEPA